MSEKKEFSHIFLLFLRRLLIITVFFPFFVMLNTQCKYNAIFIFDLLITEIKMKIYI